MKTSTILLIISIGAFIISRFARAKAKNIMVTASMTINEERIKELGLFVGQEVGLYQSDTEGLINIYQKVGGSPTELLGEYTDIIMYKHMQKKDVKAYIHSIYGDFVTVEIMFYDSL